jgi:hypothetical protein
MTINGIVEDPQFDDLLTGIADGRGDTTTAREDAATDECVRCHR